MTDTKVGEGLFNALHSGGWFAGEWTLMLWLGLALIVLLPLGGVTWLTELPSRKRGKRPGMNIPSLTRTLASFTLFLVMAFLLNHGGIPLLSTIKGHVLWVALGFVPFLGIGVVWSIWQYKLFAMDNKEEVRAIGNDYCMKENIDPSKVMKEIGEGMEFTFDKSHENKWPRYFNENSSPCLAQSGATANSPKTLFMNNKEQLGLWVMFWPTSVIFRFGTDVIGRGLDRIVMSLRRVYESVSSKHDVKVTYTDAPAPEARTEPDVGRTSNIRQI